MIAQLGTRLAGLLAYVQTPASRSHIAALIYPPKIERVVMARIPHFVEDLAARDLVCHVIDVNHVVNATIDARLEEIERAWLEDRDAVLTDIRERAIPALLEQTRDAARTGIVIWKRVGGAYPFFSVSSSIEELIGNLVHTLIVFFPGSAEGKASFRLIDERDGYQYRFQFLRVIEPDRFGDSTYKEFCDESL
jgi:hypothetical protein